MSKAERILKAVRSGARTSIEVEAATNLPLSHCQEKLAYLCKLGIIRRGGLRMFPDRRGVFVEYLPTVKTSLILRENQKKYSA